MKWSKILRDKNGFVTEDCLDMMFTSLPIVVAEQYPDSSVLYSVICDLNSIDEWRGEVERNVSYTHYLPIKKLEL